MFNRYFFVSAFVLLNLPALVAAKDLARVERVSFSDGRATMKGGIKGYAYVDYVFPAGAGESMRLSLKTNRLGNYFNVLAPGAEAAMFIGSVSGANFTGTAPIAGDYTARVYLMRSAARRGAEPSPTTRSPSLWERRAQPTPKDPTMRTDLQADPTIGRSLASLTANALACAAAPWTLRRASLIS